MTNMKKWKTIHGFVMLGSGIVFWFTQWGIVLVLTSIVSFLYFLSSEWPALWKIHRYGGSANWITLMRLLWLLLLFSISGGLSYGQIAFLLLILVLLDGADGFIARWFHHKTSFGADFDMETDSLFVCFASVLLFEKDLAGSWILLVGFMRYIFVVSKFFTGLNSLGEKRTKFGPAIAGILFVAVIIPYILKPGIYFPYLIGASILVSLSFAWSFYLLLRDNRKSQT